MSPVELEMRRKLIRTCREKNAGIGPDEEKRDSYVVYANKAVIRRSEINDWKKTNSG
jgi:hypothetical protein